MRARFLAPLVAASMVLVSLDASAASVVDSTSWAIAGTEKFKLPKQKPISVPITGLLLVFDGAGGFHVENAVITNYGGSFVAKGKRGFASTFSQTALAEYQAYLTQSLTSATGASAVNVTKFTVKAKGSVSKDGQTIKLRTKAVMKGTATIGGKTVKGNVTDKGKLSGPRAPQ